MKKVTIVGSYIVALVIDSDRLPRPGETLIGRNFHTTHGGKGSNMAVCAARLGAASGFIGKIGRDTYGDGFLSLLKEEGVDRANVLFSDQKPNATGIILCAADGSNMIVIDTAANSEFLPGDVQQCARTIENSDVIISPLEIPLETALDGAKVAKRKGVKAILNPAPAQDLRKFALNDFFALTPNETEGRICLGLQPDDQIPDADLARELLKLGAENVMLTRGEKGVLWASRAGIECIPAPNVTVVDTVGAGDAFNAGLATGLSEGMSTLEAIKLGVKTASLSVTQRGTISSYPFRKELC